jgi:hypothetical protein
MTTAVPYSSVTFDNTVWAPLQRSALFDFKRTVPASGSTSITWSYATGTSLAEVQGYAATAQAVMQAPAVAIITPAGGATVTGTPATVTGTASAPSGVSSVTVNGVAATISGGIWTANVPLTRGQNTLTATATSDDGSAASATAKVTYAPPPKVRLISKHFNGKAVVVKLECGPNGSDCRGNVTVRHTDTFVKHHKKHVKVVIATKHYAISYGKKATVTATLNGTGRRLLKNLGTLAASGTVAVIETGGKSKSAVTFKLTLK